jgi:hypothetical protein
MGRCEFVQHDLALTGAMNSARSMASFLSMNAAVGF